MVRVGSGWVRACFNSQECCGGSSPVKTEPPQIVLFLLSVSKCCSSLQVQVVKCPVCVCVPDWVFSHV